MKIIAGKNLSIIVLLLTSQALSAQEKKNFDFKRIEDNSFLLEEAYNQEPGVIQHISTFQYMKDKTWTYTFTEEWPVKGQRHQLSATIPLVSEKAYLGGIALNYRYQAVLTQRLAFSPRFSLLLPTGDYKTDMASNVFRYQTNMPLSFICSRKLVTHYNIGFTYTPSATDIVHDKWNIIDINYGASAIVLINETFNFMVEFAGNSRTCKQTYSEALGRNPGQIVKWNSLFINPGFRYAINCKSGLQIVPGIAVPVGIGSSGGEYGIFAYLSFEHPLRKQNK